MQTLKVATFVQLENPQVPRGFTRAVCAQWDFGLARRPHNMGKLCPNCKRLERECICDKSSSNGSQSSLNIHQRF